MAKSPIERYEQILAADPGSLVFVELAKAFLEAGEFQRAVEVSRQGVAHHPESILGRVLWGKALLLLGAQAEAMEQFDRAAAIEPENPYAYSLVGELLVQRGLFRAALPVLRKALSLNPSDSQVEQWLAQASAGPQDDAAGVVAEPPAPPPGPPPRPEPAAARPPPLAPRATVQEPVRAVDLLGDLPEAPRRAARSQAEISVAEVKEIARQYESKLRKEYSDTHDAPMSWPRRHWLPLTLVSAFAVAGASGVGGYRLYRQHYDEQHRRDFLDRAEGGLLQDTEASLTGASHQLAEVLAMNPKDALARALSAQTAATLFREYGGEASLREQADDLLGDPLLLELAPDPAWTARYLLTEDPSQLAPLLLALPADKAGPWVDYLAGLLLLGKGQAPEALRRFDLALKKAPAHVPTLLAVGDYYLKAGDPEHAAQFFQLAHAGSPQSIGAAVGLAEAHLASQQAGPEDERALPAASAAGVPRAWRLRLELATARVLALNGQHDKALARLQDSLGAHGEDRDAYAEARADVNLLAGRYLEAEAVSRKLGKSAKATEDAERRGRILLGLGRFKQLLAQLPATGSDPRPLHVLRARADYALGDCAAALREVDATRHGDKMPAGAAVVVALCDARGGKFAQGRLTLQQLASLPHAASATLVALGDLDQRAGDFAAASGHYQQAAAADPTDYEPHCALGRMLLAQGKQREGLAELDRALKLNNDHAEARVAYGLALVAAGQADMAMAQLTAALNAAPDDEQVSLALTRALLARKQFSDALRYATRATTIAPADPEAHRWRGKAAAAARENKLAQSEDRLASKLAAGKKR